MKFSELYKQNKLSIQNSLSEMWTADSDGHIQQTYAQKIKDLTGRYFAPDDAMPLVQNMDLYKSVSDNQRQAAEDLVLSPGHDLWNKPTHNEHAPYLHQEKCWRALQNTESDGRKHSMVITTGTGSGKTECFMMPLVHDLITNYSPDQVNAIFIYPLNALMEDQKERLQKLLAGTNLTFAVYNGNLEERDPLPNDYSNSAQLLRQRLADERQKYPNILATRDEMRGQKASPVTGRIGKANILLTNPTMLEYMLLRSTDQDLFVAGSLRWVVIDETHTYNGAGAAELAMLMRRVLLAFHVDANQVRFATSSATLGNGSNANREQELKKFISDITGTDADLVDVIKGERDSSRFQDSNQEIAACRKLLSNPTNDFMRLDELIKPGVNLSIKERLELLDTYCDPTTDIQGRAIPGLKVKVHFFYRVPSNGLYVKLDSHQNGVFDIFDEVPNSVKSGSAPYLELCRCQECGNYITVIEKAPKNRYKNLTRIERDMFDTDSSSGGQQEVMVVGLSQGVPKAGDNNLSITVNGDSWQIEQGAQAGQWHLIANSGHCCPHCGCKQSKSADSQNTESTEALTKLEKFRVGADFVSQNLSKSILDQLIPAKTITRTTRYNGRQYISFVDSRQSAARSTTHQNLESEKLWIYSTIHKELRNNPNKTYSWWEIYNLLNSDPISDILCYQFIDKKIGGNDIDTNGNIFYESKKTYILSLMVMYLAKRPRKAAAPETMGLFTTTYPDIDSITNVPHSVNDFNNLISNPIYQIGLEDWKMLLRTYVETRARSNEAYYLPQNSDQIGITQCFRFGTEKPHRRPMRQIQLDVASVATFNSLQVRLLEYLLNKDAESRGDTVVRDQMIKSNEDVIKKVLEDLWNDLLSTGVVSPSGFYGEKGWVEDRDRNNNNAQEYRLDLTKLAFKAYTDVWMCNVGEYRNVIRPVDKVFKGLAPYLLAKRVIELGKSQPWKPYLWGKGNGPFDVRLDSVYGFTDLYLQAEHTAQVETHQAKDVQEKFKNHELNILACSTTMEMGVDLGSIELVLLTSIPPQPANYKQRAGRSGRNDLSRSCCITLCTSDSLGLRTLRNPMGCLIGRVTATPKVDLQNEKVIQRHINSFLMRESGVFHQRILQGRNDLDLQIVDFFTNYDWDYDSVKRGPNYSRLLHKNTNVNSGNGIIIDPNDPPTLYYAFVDFLTTGIKTTHYNSLNSLLRGTSIANPIDAINQTGVAISKCWDNLKERVDELQQAYRNEMANARPNQNYCNLLNHKFCELMSKSLLSYWATHRFTPNANMPVNIIEFDVNMKNLNGYGDNKLRNPSYILQDALTQYAPGNTVVMDGHVEIVRGMLYTGAFLHQSTFKKLYWDGIDTTIDSPNGLKNTQRVWPVNNTTELELIQPYAFIPDVNEDKTRVMDRNRYTRVRAQLIGAKAWSQGDQGYHLFNYRSNREDPSAQILYYNEGIGYGYCVCPRCKKAVLENCPANQANSQHPIPEELNNSTDNRTGLPMHYDIRFKGRNRHACISLAQQMNTLRRNVIIGDLIQTDFTEIKIRRDINSPWVASTASTNGNNQLLTTLGILLTQAFVEYIGQERRSVNFVLMPNGHLCIFDTNPGGSGYANQLANIQTMNQVIDMAEKTASSIKTVDELIDRNTQQYAEDIDLDAALAWLREEQKTRELVPQQVQAHFGQTPVSVASLQHLIDDYMICTSSTTLFVNANFDQWNYYQQDQGNWRDHISRIANWSFSQGNQVKFFVTDGDARKMSRPVLRVIDDIKHWTSKVFCGNNPLAQGLYPLALIGSRLYFTDGAENAQMNDQWGNKNLFCCDIQALPVNGNDIDTEISDPAKMVKFTLKMSDPTVKLKSKELAAAIQEKTKEQINLFLQHCQTCQDSIEIIYQDEHMKNVMGMVTLLQFIEYYAKLFKKPFSLDFHFEEFLDSNVWKENYNSTLKDSARRDELLEKITKEWKLFLRTTDHPCTNYVIHSLPSRTLTHWRELSFKCGNKKLSFYPNGGIINGWNFDVQEAKRLGKFFSVRDVSAILDNVPMFRTQDIMYDVTVEG